MKEHYTDNTRTGRIVKYKSPQEWLEVVYQNEDKYPKPTIEDVISELECEISMDMENLDQLEYFKEDEPVILERIEGWKITDWDKIGRLKKEIGRKKYMLEIIKKQKNGNKNNKREFGE